MAIVAIVAARMPADEIDHPLDRSAPDLGLIDPGPETDQVMVR
jgi:hypothetical protein